MSAVLRVLNGPHPLPYCAEDGRIVIDLLNRIRAASEVDDQQAAAAKAAVWDEAAEATADWMASNPSPAGIPQDPPRNPYDEEGQ